MACSEAEAAKKQPTLINTSQLRELLAGSSPPLFVDVRPAKEFANGSIPGAINIPVDDMPQRWNTLPKNRVIVFYESGRSSGMSVPPGGRREGYYWSTGTPSTKSRSTRMAWPDGKTPN